MKASCKGYDHVCLQKGKKKKTGIVPTIGRLADLVPYKAFRVRIRVRVWVRARVRVRLIE